MAQGDRTPQETPYQMALAVDTQIDFPNETVMIQVRLATKVLSKWILDTRELALKEALIKLGWTPPHETKN